MGEGQEQPHHRCSGPLRNLLWILRTVRKLCPFSFSVVNEFLRCGSSKKPTVQLLVNGEPVLSAINTASYVVHHSSGRMAAVGAHSGTCLFCCCCLLFVSCVVKFCLCLAV